MWRRETVSADHGGIAAGRDAIIGIHPDQLPAIIEAATRDRKQLTDEQRETITSLEGKLGVSESALRAFFLTLDEANVPLEQQETRLIEIAEDYTRVRAQVSAAPGDPPEIAKLKDEAKAALDAGEFERADSFLEQVLKAEDVAIERRQLEAAHTSAQRGDIALTRLRYREAAQHFTAAAKRVPRKYEEEALTYLDREAMALYRQGGEFGDNVALADAISRYKALLDLRTRERVPLDWAMTQNNLGNTLRSLGERESGTARLEEAVAAYRKALRECTRERVALGWAMTQNHLGAALASLGERESGTARLQEAVAAFREALREYTRKRVPLGWAMTQNNLGNALTDLGQRESGTARLEEAVAAYRKALRERTRERVPLDWAMTQNNLGNALSNLGQRESGTARLEEAVAAYRKALSIFEAARASYYASATKRNIESTQTLLAERRGL